MGDIGKITRERLAFVQELQALARAGSIFRCYDIVSLKKLVQISKNDPGDEVQTRARLALKAFTMESCS